MRYLILLPLLLIVARVEAEEKAPPKITFDDHVKPIFQQKCVSCHNPDKKSADLDLTNYGNLMQGGASGAVIEPGDASASYLYKLVVHDEEPAMPPESPKIEDAMIETLRKWIEGGVLESSGSVAKESKKKKFDLALAAPSTERPAEIPMPAKLSLQPLVVTPSRTAIDALATSPWAPLAAVSSQKQVLLYNTQTLDLLGVLPFPEGTPRVLKFSRNGSLLLCGGGVAGASGRVVVWNIRTGERIIEIGDELDEVLAADISSDQKLVALGGPLKVVRIYATETGQLLHELRKHTDWITSLEFSPDSVLLASGDRNGGLQVWEGWTGREYLTLKGHTAGVPSVSWRSDSNILASCSEDSTIRLWEMENGGEVKNWGAHGGGALNVEFTREGRLFSCGRDRTPKAWDQNGAQQVAYEAFGDLALRATYCDETNRAISGDWTGEIRVWNATDGARLGQLVMNVPLLETRLADANQMMAARQAEIKPITDSFQAAQSTFQKVSGDLANAQKLSAETKQKADAAAVALVAAQAAMTQATTENDAAKKSAEVLVAVAPMLKDAADKANAAAAQLPGDETLKNAALTITTTSEAKAKEMEMAKTDEVAKLAAMQQATKVMAETQQQATDMATALANAQQAEAALLPLLKPAEDAFNVAKTAMDQSTAAVTEATASVAKWTSEIEFNNKFKALQQQRKDAMAMLATHEEELTRLQSNSDQAQTVLQTSQAELAGTQASLTKNEADYQAALTAIETAKAAQVAATQAKDAANNNVNVLSQSLGKIGEAVAKMNEALAMSKEDPTMITAMNALNTGATEKAQQLEVAKADVVAKTQAEQVAITNVANTEKAAADLLAMQEPMKKKIADTVAAIPQYENAATEAKQIAEAYAPTVATSKEQVDEVAKLIAQLQGLS